MCGKENNETKAGLMESDLWQESAGGCQKRAARSWMSMQWTSLVQTGLGLSADIELMMYWGWRWVVQVEPPSKLVFWSGLRRALEGFLEERLALIRLFDASVPELLAAASLWACRWSCMCLTECTLRTAPLLCLFKKYFLSFLAHALPAVRARAPSRAAPLNYTPRLLKGLPQKNQPPCLSRSTPFLLCGIYQRETIAVEHRKHVHYWTLQP